MANKNRNTHPAPAQSPRKQEPQNRIAKLERELLRLCVVVCSPRRSLMNIPALIRQRGSPRVTAGLCAWRTTKAVR